MSETAKLFDKQLSLLDLQTQVAAYEAAFGPLHALGHTADNSAAVYTSGMSPDNPVELRPKAGGALPAGYDKVTEGTVWIIGQTQDVVAVRKR